MSFSSPVTLEAHVVAVAHFVGGTSSPWYPYSCNCNQLEQEDAVFETMAFLSTVGLIVIFVVLFQIDRAGRREEEEARK